MLSRGYEQQRLDRDAYINIDWTNTTSSDKANFQKWNELGFTGQDVWPFDFNSIMLYGSYAGTVRPNDPVMTTKSGDIWWGNRAYLSQGDIASVCLLYGPPHGTLKVDYSEVNSWPSKTSDGAYLIYKGYGGEISITVIAERYSANGTSHAGSMKFISVPRGWDSLTVSFTERDFE